MSNLKYKINSFDPDLKRIEVDFFEDGKARIQLVDPLPTTTDELEDVLRQFVPSAEVAAARASSVDLSFINALLQQTRSTAREKLVDRITIAPGAEVLASEMRYFHAQIETVLRKHKLI